MRDGALGGTGEPENLLKLLDVGSASSLAEQLGEVLHRVKVVVDSVMSGIGGVLWHPVRGFMGFLFWGINARGRCGCGLGLQSGGPTERFYESFSSYCASPAACCWCRFPAACFRWRKCFVDQIQPIQDNSNQRWASRRQTGSKNEGVQSERS